MLKDNTLSYENQPSALSHSALSPDDQSLVLNKYLFQASFVFLLLLTLPIDPYYYRELFAHANSSPFKAIFRLLDYVPYWGYYSAWDLKSFTGWLWALGLALVVAVIWNRTDKKFDYDRWNYFLRVILRYRLAIALLAYGVLLLFPIQAPFPSLSDLHTKYGDFLPWKIYYHSLGVSTAGYEPTLGIAEIITGLLLLWRRTTIIGAGLASAILINVVLVNFAYDLGSHVLSVYLLLISTVLIAHDAPRLWALLVKEKAATADHYEPVVSKQLRRWGRIAFFLFFIIYAGLAFGKGNDKNTPGIKGADGYYNVSHFVTNNQELPYSLTDTSRWQDVVLEKWNTLSVRINKSVFPSLQSPDDDTYENVGNGGRIFYSYVLKDSTLRLVNENNPSDVYQFVLKQPAADTFLLDGADHNGHPLHIELDKINKTYLLYLGRRKPVKVY
jgi:hypothetical protein